MPSDNLKSTRQSYFLNWVALIATEKGTFETDYGLKNFGGMVKF